MAEFNENETFDLAEYDPTWPSSFESESELLAGVFGADLIDIQHIGSTSIPGLRAKPIIDLLAAVESFAPVEQYVRLLTPLGYHHHPHPDEDERIFFWKGVPRTHHLHVVEYATWEHQRHIIFRDYLRAHPEIAQWYEQIKRELWIAFRGNRPAYTKGKTAFIKTIMARAVEEIVDPSLRRLVEQAKKEEPLRHQDQT
jgi:GrpB-like predicted nucleotidyltransferase (UPF0157 family)